MPFDNKRERKLSAQLKHINREKHLDYFVLLNNQDHERAV